MNDHIFATVEPQSPKIPPEDGSLFPTPSFCRHRADHNKCAKFYKTIHSFLGFHTCPYGFSASVHRAGTSNLISTGLKIQGHFDRKKLKQKKAQDFIPTFTEDEFLRFLEFSLSYLEQNRQYNYTRLELQEAREFMYNTFHEIRKLNRDIKSQAEELNSKVDRSSSNFNNTDFLKYRIQNVYATSSLISIRLDTYDLLSNPLGVTASSPILIAVYKKFEKVKHCLDNKSKQRKVNLIFEGNSYKEIQGYEIFELLPYVLFENALKYSPEGQDIRVRFESSANIETIQVSNIGPKVFSEEIATIFEKGKRGRLAQAHFPGTGIGLFFAKQVCDIHKVCIEISSDPHVKFTLNEIPYSNFDVCLTLP